MLLQIYENVLYDALAQPNVIITINLDSEKHVEFIINCENVKETDKQTPFSLQKIGYKILFFAASLLLSLPLSLPSVHNFSL